MANGRTRRPPFLLLKITADYSASANSLKTIPFPSDNNPWVLYRSPQYYWVVAGFSSGNQYNIVCNLNTDTENMMVVYNTSSSSRSGTATLILFGIPTQMLRNELQQGEIDGFVRITYLRDRVAEYQNLSLSAGSSSNLAWADFKANGGAQYHTPDGFSPLGFIGLWGGANKVSVRMLNLYEGNDNMMEVKNIGTSGTGNVNPSVSPVYIMSEYVTDLDGDE